MTCTLDRKHSVEYMQHTFMRAATGSVMPTSWICAIISGPDVEQMNPPVARHCLA